MTPSTTARPGAAARTRGPLRAAAPGLGRALLLLLAVSLLVFTATEVLPGDAADLRTTPGADDAAVADLRARLDQDGPVWQRYLAWAAGLLRGDLGVSLVNDRPVLDALLQRLPATGALILAALALAVPAMLLLGWWAGSSRRLHGPLSAALTGGAALPAVVVAAGLAAVLSGMLGLVPAVSVLPPGRPPLAAPGLLVLPALSLAMPTALFGAALLSGAVADALDRPHVVDARRRGRGQAAVAAVEVLPFVLAPLVRVLAVSAGGLLAATTVVETLFGYPGLGSLLVSSVSSRDVPVVQAIALLGAVVVLPGLAAADALARRTDLRGGSR